MIVAVTCMIAGTLMFFGGIYLQYGKPGIFASVVTTLAASTIAVVIWAMK